VIPLLRLLQSLSSDQFQCCDLDCLVELVDTATWLRELGLERYEQVFRDNDIDVDLLSDLN
jgi:hypothetical protein